MSGRNFGWSLTTSMIFMTSGGAAGALIGLLFVAVSVSAGRLELQTVDAQLHRNRASASFTAFTNALAVSLFSLIPGHKIGPTALVVAAFGLFSCWSPWRRCGAGDICGGRRPATQRSSSGLPLCSPAQFYEGIDVWMHPGDLGSVETIAMVVVICFLIGVARAWELIRGPEVGSCEYSPRTSEEGLTRADE
jgi:hypothetical protein